MARPKDFDEDDVLNKAICIFWHKGYNGTSMQDLVDGLGISRSSLYDTYGDKHTLYVKALETYQKAAGNQVCNIINNAASAKEAIKQLLELTIKDLLSDEQRKGCFSVNAGIEVAPHDAEVNSMICRGEQQVEDAFFHAIKKGQESGEITNKQDARALARFIFNAVKGMQVSAKGPTDKAFFDDIIQTTMLVLD
ncbi:transcriptional regulator, TetR family [Mucilaginibacter pineti]|uniref:Transcriptional regulator, TetR family n=1 Tax=Mucilaginibacter pineti TaxID=1391627 RepID=A0A1G7FHJ0_9SPHI|nr:TetR/AcrR family transcriptional regulator [Mucilaginibacter pineti]SDE75321.1 transcriptional regulator, TetR family [Mucilaginibacter pineti]